MHRPFLFKIIAMQIKEIASSANPLLKNVRSLHDRSGRKKAGLFLLEGAKLLDEALKNGIEIVDVFVSRTFWQDGLPGMPKFDLEELVVVEDNVFNQLATTETPQGILATAEISKHELADVLNQKNGLLLVADTVQDPGNLGTIARAGLAFGATALILTKGTVDPFSPKVIRSAMGALFALPVVCDVPFEELADTLKQHEIPLYALDQDAEQSLWTAEFPSRLALVFGNEGNGMKDEDMAKADKVLAIPISERSESLNVAMAASITLSYISSKRGMAG